MMRTSLYISLSVITSLFLAPFSSAAHFIVGQVINASDNTPADGHIIIAWIPSHGINDNLTDIIGPSGNSGAHNIYMIDCELLTTSCVVGDQLNIQVLNTGDSYITRSTNISVSGAGFNVVPNLSLNSPPNVTSLWIDDDIYTPAEEIDLMPGTAKNVTCYGALYDADGETNITNVTAALFNTAAATFGSNNDNNNHYNQSCSIDTNYGTNREANVTCVFSVLYYANPGNWNCTISATDELSINRSNTNKTNINQLLSISVNSALNYGILNLTDVGGENIVNVTNFGNVKINLSLEGYGTQVNDNLSMNCTVNGSIAVGYQKYNLTTSNPGQLTLSQFESLYKNLSSSRVVNKFNLNFRQNDLTNEAFNATYWRIYPPSNVDGTCSGNIIFGAALEAGT